MRTRILIAGVLAALLPCVPLQADNYAEMWKEAKKYEQKDLPKSACQTAEKILKKARKENNRGQLIAAFLYRSKLRQVLVPDSFYSDIPKLEKLKQSTTDNVFKAVCASVLADIYRDRVYMSRRIPADYVAHPDSLKEWSSQQFREAAMDNYRLSMSTPDLLLNSKASDYVPFVVQGKNADFFNGDLLNIVARQAINGVTELNLPESDTLCRNWYATLLSLYRKTGNREAELLCMLDSIDMVNKPSPGSIIVNKNEMTEAERDSIVLSTPQCKAYFNLLSGFADLPVSVEVYWRMLQIRQVSLQQKMKWAKEACACYPNSSRRTAFENWMAQATSPSLTWVSPQSLYPQQSVSCVFQRRNLTDAEIVWYKLPAHSDMEKIAEMNDKAAQSYFRKYGKQVTSQKFHFTDAPDYETVSDTVQLDIPDVGYYGVWVKIPGVEDAEGKMFVQVPVSRLKVVAGEWPGHRLVYRVVDAMTGTPVCGAKVRLGYYDRGKKVNLEQTYTTGSSGTASIQLSDELIKQDFRLYANVTYGDDTYLQQIRIFGHYTYSDNQSDYDAVRIYTDRAIYRPGQTVYVGGIAYSGKGDEMAVARSQKISLRLLDANYNEVAVNNVLTDDMGGFNTSFVLPSSGLLGTYVIRTDKSAVSFSVENYKRPTFSVTWNEMKEAYSQGDSVSLTGLVMNYNGVPVRHACVVTESALRSWWGRQFNFPDEISSDTVYTDEKGCFTLKTVIPVASDKLPFYGLRFECKAVATNTAGESHKALCMLPLGKERMILNVAAPDMWECHSAQTFTANVQTQSGQSVEQLSALTYDLYRVHSSGRKVLVSGAQPISVGVPVQLKSDVSLVSGKYELKVRAIAGRDTVEAVHPFVYFDLTQNRLAVDTIEWYYATGDTLRYDEPVKIQIGSSEKNVTLYYTLFAKDKVLKDTVFNLSDSLLTFRYEPDEAYGDGALAYFMFVKGDEVYERRQQLFMPQTDKALRLSWSTFRDKLTPGNEETWTLRVFMPDGKPASAQLMATLYDASLEQFAKHDWDLTVSRYLSLPYYYTLSTGARQFRLRFTHSPKLGKETYWTFDSFDRSLYQGAIRTFTEVLTIRENAVNVQSVENLAPKMSQKSLVGRIGGLSDVAEVEMTADTETSATGNETVSKYEGIRENLQETAFFYPALRTDKDGNVTMVFTLPESLTTWNFLALAHTADMSVGKMKAQATASKDIMAQLSLPRFVRSGDKATLSAQLFNQTEKAVKGKVTMEVFDPETEQVLWKDSRKVKVQPSSDSVVSFSCTLTSKIPLVACRVIWDAGRMTDGEQRYLPVLEDKEWITETLPFTVDTVGTTVIPVDRLYQNAAKEASDHRLTVEYAANPLWYAVQALPVLTEPKTDDALSLSNALYAMTLADKLAGNTDVKRILSQWSRSGSTADDAIPNGLDEVTGLLTEETPWVTEVETAQQQINKLQQLFDSNQRKDKLNQCLGGLARLQYADGSFSWFNGMSGNLSVTVRVAEWLARSGMLDGTREVPEQLNLNAMLKYLSDRFHETVARDRETHIKQSVSAWLPYLYILTKCDRRYLNQINQSDRNYMIGRVADDGYSLSLSDKATAALVLSEAGRKQVADELMKSLREHLVSSAEGLHLEYPSGGFYSSETKIMRHVRLMEAFQTLDGDRETLQSLSRWLLLQKRVQNWPTTSGTAEAVYALVQTQSSQLGSTFNDVLRVNGTDNKPVCVLKTADSPVAGLGYVKTIVNDKQLADGVSALTVTRQSDSSQAWGAVYAQYLLPSDQVKAQTSGMQIRCEWSNTNPKVGDKVTLHYVITASQDYDYVCLKAARPACVEPVRPMSGYVYRNGLGYYQEVRDASTSYFFDHLPKGTYVLDVEMYVERPGIYQSGIARLFGVYAPEFAAHSDAARIVVKE